MTLSRPIGVLGRGFLGTTLLTQFSWPDSSWFTLLPHTIAGFTNTTTYHPIPFDWADPSTWENLPKSDCDLVLTIPPVLEDIDKEIERVRYWGQWMKRNRPGVQRLVYISTTGVYPNESNIWSESSDFTPDSPKGLLRWKTEQVLDHIFDSVSVRSGAIYGPSRHIGTRIKSGKPIPNGQQPVHRIHVTDLAGIIKRVLEQKSPPPVINAVDDDPAPTINVARWLVRQSGLTTDSADIKTNETYPSRTRRAVAKNRFIINSVLKNELGFTLTFPTYKEGLIQSIQADNSVC